MAASLEECTLPELLRRRHLLAEHVSRNECIDEVKTADIQYIATDYFIALHHLRERQDRLSSLDQAQRHLESFFDWLEAFQLLRRPATEQRGDAAVLRQQKISRFHQIRELQSLCHPSCLRSDDEEVQRQGWLSWVRVKGLLAVDELEFVVAEQRLLQGQVQSSLAAVAGGDSERAGQRPSTSVSVHRPFVLTREQARDRVFRPGHCLPTMSIDEFLDLEAQRGNLLRGTDRPAGHADPETDRDFDAETQRLRSRDERWDWIRRGSGNTHNRS